MKNSTTRLIDHRPRRTRLALSFGATALVLASLTIASGAATSAAVRPLAASAPCATSVSAGTGTVAGSLILGVTAGTTKVTFDCNTSASPSIVAEASLLDAIGTSTVSETSEADIASLGSFTASTTDTGCPAAVAGQCTIATFTVPAAFSASDAKATCPPLPGRDQRRPLRLRDRRRHRGRTAGR